MFKLTSSGGYTRKSEVTIDPEVFILIIFNVYLLSSLFGPLTDYFFCHSKVKRIDLQ